MNCEKCGMTIVTAELLNGKKITLDPRPSFLILELRDGVPVVKYIPNAHTDHSAVCAGVKEESNV